MSAFRGDFCIEETREEHKVESQYSVRLVPPDLTISPPSINRPNNRARDNRAIFKLGQSTRLPVSTSRLWTSVGVMVHLPFWSGDLAGARTLEKPLRAPRRRGKG
jgi:hypothetical protein